MRDFLLLTKPTICLLVVITGAAGLVWEGSLLGEPGRIALVLLGLFLAAGSANAFNQYFERDLDALMSRTARKRPLATRRVDPRAALAFAVAIGVAGVGLFAWQFNLLSAALTLGTIAFYAFFYTLYLKPRTPQNIVIGGIAGAMGPVIAWAAAANTLSVPALLMFLVIFLWTPPHFWALALCLKDDYSRSRLPMMPNVVGEDATLRQMFWYSIALVAVSLGLVFYDAGIVYMAFAVVCGAVFLWRMHVSMRDRVPKAHWGLFGWSILYLFILFAAMMADTRWRYPIL
jgi:protoheme IX farnesyltransferase